MSISAGYTREQVQELVYAYEHQPHGSKGAWLKDRGISYDRFRRWRLAVVDGDVARGLVPRESSPMVSPPRRHAAAQHCNGQEQQVEIGRLARRVQELQATNEALGKAIGLLHLLNEQEPDTSQTSKPSDS